MQRRTKRKETSENLSTNSTHPFSPQIILIALDFLLFIMSLYDVIFSRRLGGDPTMSTRDPRGDHATTFNNPGFQERANGQLRWNPNNLVL